MLLMSTVIVNYVLTDFYFLLFKCQRTSRKLFYLIVCSEIVGESWSLFETKIVIVNLSVIMQL